MLLYGWIARTKSGASTSSWASTCRTTRTGSCSVATIPQFAAVVDRTFRQLAESRELRWIYRRWFQRRVVTGENLALPMSPQLESIFDALGLPEE